MTEPTLSSGTHAAAAATEDEEEEDEEEDEEDEEVEADAAEDEAEEDESARTAAMSWCAAAVRVTGTGMSGLVAAEILKKRGGVGVHELCACEWVCQRETMVSAKGLARCTEK